MIICKKCGSNKIFKTMWVNINTHEVGEETEFDDYYCEDCQEECQVTVK